MHIIGVELINAVKRLLDHIICSSLVSMFHNYYYVFTIAYRFMYSV